MIGGLGRVGNDGNLRPGLEHDVPKQVQLVTGKRKRHRDTVRPEPSGATDAVEIGFGVPRNVLKNWSALNPPADSFSR